MNKVSKIILALLICLLVVACTKNKQGETTTSSPTKPIIQVLDGMTINTIDINSKKANIYGKITYPVVKDTSLNIDLKQVYKVFEKDLSDFTEKAQTLGQNLNTKDSNLYYFLLDSMNQSQQHIHIYFHSSQHFADQKEDKKKNWHIYLDKQTQQLKIDNN